MRVVLASLLLVLAGSAVAAAPGPAPSLGPPDTSHPAGAAFVAWHAALIRGDFAAYRRLTPVIPNISDHVLRQMFDQLRLAAPKTVMVTDPRAKANGSFEFHTAGCMGNRPVVGIVAVGNQGGTWRVAGSGWEPSPNPRISEHIKCP